MSPGHMLLRQLAPRKMASVKDCSRNLTLKFGKNQVSNSWAIADQDNSLLLANCRFLLASCFWLLATCNMLLTSCFLLLATFYLLFFLPFYFLQQEIMKERTRDSKTVRKQERKKHESKKARKQESKKGRNQENKKLWHQETKKPSEHISK